MNGLGFVPGSHHLVVGGPKGFLAVVDADSGQVLERIHGHRAAPAPAISGDGRMLVTASDEATVRLWSLPDLRAGRRPAAVRPQRRGRSGQPRWTVADGRVADGSGGDGALEVWDLPRQRRVTRLAVPDTPTAVRFSPDGRLLGGGLRQRPGASVEHSRLGAGHAPARGRFRRHLALAISRDGRTLATGSVNRTLRLWDIESEQAVGTPLPGPGRGVGAVAPYFTPDGAALIASYDTGRAYRWDIRPEALARHACRVAGRRLTRAEWTEFLPGRDYDPAC